MKLFLKTMAALSVAALPASAVSYYISDFSGLNPGDPLDGYVDGGETWSQTPGNDDPLSPLSFGNTLNGQPAASIGAYYDVPLPTPATTAYTVSRPITGGNGPAFGDSKFSLSFAITDSTNTYPDRNVFTFATYNGANEIFSFNLFPMSQGTDPDGTDGIWRMNITNNGVNLGSFATANFLEGIEYDFSATFFFDGVNFNYALAATSASNPGGNQFFNGTFTGADPTLQVTDFVVGANHFTPINTGTGTNWGDSFVTFNNINVVPEPSSAALFALALGGLFIRRKR